MEEGQKPEEENIIKLPKPDKESETNPRVIVLLDGCCLEAIPVGKELELLNCDDHQGFMKKRKRDIGEARPDIVHQCLLNLLDSPLNRAGYLRVYIRTTTNILIEVNPSVRIPRTFKRFAGLMVQLLTKMSVKASDGGQTLLKCIKNPITQYLPPGCKKIGASYSSKKLVDIEDYVAANFKKEPAFFIIGGFAHGKISEDMCDELIAYSSYPLSGAIACSKVCTAFERHWGVL